MDFSGYTLISDLDGTLLDDEKNISKKNLEAIEYFKEKGGKFTVATGRASNRVGMYKEILKPDIPGIFSNGSSIAGFDDGKIYWQGYIDNSVIEIVKDLDISFPEFGLEIFANNSNYFIHINKYIEWQMKTEGFYDNRCCIEEVKMPWQKILIATDKNIIDILNDRYSEYKDRVEFTRSDEYYYEIIGKDLNKGTALYKLKEFADIDLDKMICIGDNLNDVQLIKNASLGVAVANACDAVKNNADIIVTDNNNSAIYDLIDKLDRR